ncbi:MAG TPA: hypothetical protein DD827_09915 [Gammaproteobacteria bacterium]|nr:hypothetical protein [Gammaproteobacteria bacterium]
MASARAITRGTKYTKSIDEDKSGWIAERPLRQKKFMPPSKPIHQLNGGTVPERNAGDIPIKITTQYTNSANLLRIANPIHTSFNFYEARLDTAV